MTRIRKIAVVVSLVLAMTAVQVPASADPVSETTCTIQELAQRYGWTVPICV